eukprot:8695175-Pyramimonas_sp.AAC.3
MLNVCNRSASREVFVKGKELTALWGAWLPRPRAEHRFSKRPRSGKGRALSWANDNDARTRRGLTLGGSALDDSTRARKPGAFGR